MTENIQNGLATTKSKFILSSEAYDTLRYIVNYVIPALAAFYAGLVTFIPALPYGLEVVGIAGLVVVLLNVMLGKSKSNYIERKEDSNPTLPVGTVYVNTADGDIATTALKFASDIDPNELANLDTVRLQISSSSQ